MGQMKRETGTLYSQELPENRGGRRKEGIKGKKTLFVILDVWIIMNHLYACRVKTLSVTVGRTTCNIISKQRCLLMRQSVQGRENLMNDEGEKRPVLWDTAERD